MQFAEPAECNTLTFQHQRVGLEATLNGLAADYAETFHHEVLNNEINTAVSLQPNYWPAKIKCGLWMLAGTLT